MPTVVAHLVIEFFIGALLFALGAWVVRQSVLTDATRSAYWDNFLRNMGYGLTNVSAVYLVFQDLLSVRNLQGVIAIGVTALLLWAYAVRRIFCRQVLLEDLGRIGRVGFTTSLAGYVAQQSSGRLIAAGVSFVVMMLCVFAMNMLTSGNIPGEGNDDDGGMGI
jgi:hypothetical protein